MVRDKEIEVNDIDGFFNELFDLQKTGNYFFRGISKEEHYSPTLFREFQKIRKKRTPYKFVWKYETRLLEKFGRYSVQYLPAISTPLDWVASAQHFGIPTRLLDWTFDPFYGLYFSVFYNKKNNASTEEDKHYHLLVINKNRHLYFEEVPRIMPFNFTDRIDTNNQLLEDFKYLVGSISGQIEISIQLTKNSVERNFIQQIKKDLGESKEPSKLFFCSINHSNPRIVAQNGLFQIPRTYGEGATKGWIKRDIVNGCHKIYKIHKDQRQEILVKLSNMNINSIRLFPDLQSICDYIRITTTYDVS